MMAKGRNNPPKATWRSTDLACGTLRQVLFVAGTETPFFIDSARGIRAHRTQGDEHGLYGAGMGPEIRPGCRIAAVLGSSRSARILKHRAEQMALPA